MRYRLRAASPMVVRTQIGLYTANLRANTDAVRAMVVRCEPRPATVVWVLSHQPRMTSTILDGLRDAEAELAADGVRVTYAALPDAVLTTAKRWSWWQQVEAEGRYVASMDDVPS